MTTKRLKYEPKVGDYVHPPNTQWVGKVMAIETVHWNIYWVKVPDEYTEELHQTKIILKNCWRYPPTRAQGWEEEQNKDILKKALGINE